MSKNIGEKIRQIRELKGYSQEYISNKLGVSQRAYSKIERNERRVTIELLEKISVIFKVNKRDLMICYYSDLIVNQIECENDYSEILQTAKNKILNANRKSIAK